ncbi:hypothetical protein C1H46_017995 [Malus baccata]|uniref:Uncharacterized protein n=1 Tax=Malus baccata TaxID=106549 RepID=A0A540MC99_MALBA|nr:hypothetical protein C1H46_017995 [Malus baccata]
MAIRVLIDVDVHLPLKPVLVVNRDEELPTFISYENLFEVCFYCGRRKVENCGCDEEDKDVSWFMVNKVFGDDPNVLPDEGGKGLGLAFPGIEDDLIFCFPQPEIMKEVGSQDESRVGLDDDNKTITHVVEGPPTKRRRDLVGEGTGYSHAVDEN